MKMCHFSLRRLAYSIFALLVLVCVGSYTGGSEHDSASAASVLSPLAAKAEVPVDENWDDRFDIPGVRGSVYAIAITGTDVYVGGRFTTVGDVAANNVARWDGNQWQSLSSGVSDDDQTTSVNALAVVGNDVYVGGDFILAGGISAKGVARWDGTQWYPVGKGLLSAGRENGFVFSIVLVGIDLYVAGAFDHAGDVKANSVAMWDGSQWHSVGSGVTYHTGEAGNVKSMVIVGNNIFVGGSFEQAGTLPAHNVARWDGSQWFALGAGLEGGDWVYTLIAKGSDIYAGGSFTNSGDTSVNHIARWDGTQWLPLVSGGINGVSGNVYAMAVIGNDIYVGGLFQTAGDTNIHTLAKWAGTQWYSLGTGVDEFQLPEVTALAANGNDLYVGGYFTAAGEVSAKNVAKWDGSIWHAFGSQSNGVHGPVKAIALSGSDVYIAGSFIRVGNVLTKGVARWNGANWSPLGSGIEHLGFSRPEVNAIVAVGNNIYVGGLFDLAGGVLVNNIARWDGSQWHSVGAYTTNSEQYSVKALASDGNNLYAGGHFDSIGGVAANNIARWDGSVWSALGAGVSSDVFSLLLWGNDLYVGGYFATAGDVEVNHVARWDGSVWHSLGEGTNSSVMSLITNGTDLYAGGAFTMTGSLSTNYIARWNGTQWHSLGIGANNGVSGIVQTLAIVDRAVYVGGQFSMAGSVSASNIAMWDGTQWHSLGSGLNSRVLALAPISSDLYVGGDFDMAGGKSSYYYGIWHSLCPISFSDVPIGSDFYSYITCLACNGVLGGYGDGTFRPYNFITRGQVAKIVSNAVGFSDPPGEQLFEDVTPDSAFYPWVQRLANRGYINGYPCGSGGEPCGPGNRPYFRPNGNVTRGQISKIVSNAIGFNDPPGEQLFQDTPPDNPFYVWVQRLANRGVLGGYPCGVVDEPCVPPGNLPYFRTMLDSTRGQGSKILANAFFPNCTSP